MQGVNSGCQVGNQSLQECQCYVPHHREEKQSRGTYLSPHHPPSPQGDLLRPKAQDLIPRVGLLAGSGRAPECLWNGAAVLCCPPALSPHWLAWFFIHSVFCKAIIQEAQQDTCFPSLLGSPQSSCVPTRCNQAQSAYAIFNKSLETSFSIFLDDSVCSCLIQFLKNI